MSLKVEIDKNSGFCGGVIRAIDVAEKYLVSSGGKLYSLGSIVHNEEELARLNSKGLETIELSDIDNLPNDSTVLIRAHGEPPSTYSKVNQAGVKVIDCTCPVVLMLQKRIREAYSKINPLGGQIIIFGKVGHAEVLGLMGQVDGNALVVEDMDMYNDYLQRGLVKLKGPIELFSQTTKSPSAYADLCSRVEEDMAQFNEISVEQLRNNKLLIVHNTICSQVSNRHQGLTDFAKSHSVIVFVSGKASSNGKVLYNLCKNVNERSYRVGSPEEIDRSWFNEDDSVGICGATSTPKWLLEAVAKKILFLI